MPAALLQLAKWVRHGRIDHEFDILHGIEQTPTAFFHMLNGESQGKQLVKLAEIDDQLDPAPRKIGKLLTADFFPTRTIGGLIRLAPVIKNSLRGRRMAHG